MPQPYKIAPTPEATQIARFLAIQKYPTAFRLGGKFNEATQEALRDANQTSTIFFSLVKKEDSNLKKLDN